MPMLYSQIQTTNTTPINLRSSLLRMGVMVFVALLTYAVQSQAETYGLNQGQVQNDSQNKSPVISSRLQWLLGKQNTYDGPNCLNATAYVLGFTNYLTQNSGSEIKYYLETACERVKSPVAQDVVIINREGTTEHSAIIIDKSTIFEKLSTSGFFSIYDDKNESTYKFTAIKKSRFINDCLNDSEKCELQYYRCQNKSSGLAEIRTCENTEIGRAILKTKALQQASSFTTNRDYTIGTNKDRTAMNALLPLLEKIQLDNKCALYYLTQIESLLWQDSSIQNFDSQVQNGWVHHKLPDSAKALVDTSVFKATFYEKIEILKSQLKNSPYIQTIQELGK